LLEKITGLSGLITCSSVTASDATLPGQNALGIARYRQVEKRAGQALLAAREAFVQAASGLTASMALGTLLVGRKLTVISRSAPHS